MLVITYKEVKKLVVYEEEQNDNNTKKLFWTLTPFAQAWHIPT